MSYSGLDGEEGETVWSGRITSVRVLGWSAGAMYDVIFVADHLPMIEYTYKEGDHIELRLVRACTDRFRINGGPWILVGRAPKQTLGYQE